MRKNFSLIHEKIKPERMADKIKNEVKRYIKRERNKTLPEGVDFWDFDCRIGLDSENAMAVHEKEINMKITEIVEQEADGFYLEILAKEGKRTKKK